MCCLFGSGGLTKGLAIWLAVGFTAALPIAGASAQPDARSAPDATPTNGASDATGPTDTTPPPADPLALIQSFSSKQFGHLRAPLAWKIEDLPEGVRLVQNRPENNPSAPVALLEITRIKTPEGIGTQALLEALLEELRDQFGAVEVQHKESKSFGKNKGLIIDCALAQEGKPMRYLILLLAVRDEFVLATLGAPLEHFDAVNPQTLLLGVLESIDHL